MRGGGAKLYRGGVGRVASDACQHKLVTYGDTSIPDTAYTVHICRAGGQGRPSRAPSVPVQCPFL